jgi:hypothetical protein
VRRAVWCRCAVVCGVRCAVSGVRCAVVCDFVVVCGVRCAAVCGVPWCVGVRRAVWCAMCRGVVWCGGVWCAVCGGDQSCTPSTILLCMWTAGQLGNGGATRQSVPLNRGRWGLCTGRPNQPPTHDSTELCAWHVSPTPSARCPPFLYAFRLRGGGTASQHVPTPALGCVGRSRLCCGRLNRPDSTELCAWHVSSTPCARCPPLLYVCRLRGCGQTGALPPNMCPIQPWMCVGVWGLGVKATHPRPHQGMSMACVHDLTHPLSTTLLCM